MCLIFKIALSYKINWGFLMKGLKILTLLLIGMAFLLISTTKAEAKTKSKTEVIIVKMEAKNPVKQTEYGVMLDNLLHGDAWYKRVMDIEKVSIVNKLTDEYNSMSKDSYTRMWAKYQYGFDDVSRFTIAQFTKTSA